MMEVDLMLDYKACPRCEGDLHENRDIYGSYKECLQCGYMVDMDNPNGVLAEMVSRDKAVLEAGRARKKVA